MLALISSNDKQGNYKCLIFVSALYLYVMYVWPYIQYRYSPIFFVSRYRSYCSNIARTFLVNPSEKIQSIYNLLVNTEEHIMSELKDGVKLSSVYKSAVSFVKKESPDLVDNLTKNFGFAMGIEFREGSLTIAPK